MTDLAYIDLTFTDEFKRLDASDDGRYYLASIADRLGRSVAAAARIMAGDSLVVDDLVRLTVAPNGRPGRPEPLTPFYADEIARMEGTVLDACEQLPRGHHGLVVVETEKSWAPNSDLLRHTAAWLEGPIGREYDHVDGVLYTYRPWWSEFPSVLLAPVWRCQAPRWLIRSKRLQRLAEALGWADFCAWDWRRGGAAFAS